MRRLLAVCLGLLAATASAHAQFLATFDDPELRVDPGGSEGWAFFSGDGEATIDFRATGEGYASILVDATRDRRNVWWALVKRVVSEEMDLELLARSGWELRVEARIRSSHAPRRINLHVNTQRTTDFHSHLKEFEISEPDAWHTISMTTRGFPVLPGDTVNAQMALMDWGLGTYRVDIDYLKADVVEVEKVGPDLGEPLPYHPPIPNPSTFDHEVAVAESAVVDTANPDVNLGGWSVIEAGIAQPVLTVNGSMWVILRWDLGSLAGRRVAGLGLLELTTHSVQRNAEEIKDFGLVRVVEILGGHQMWRRDTVTATSVALGGKLGDILNPQTIIDWPVTGGEGATTRFTISRPVLQRLVDGRTLGLAVKPLGSINASFLTSEGNEPRLLFNLEK